MNQLPADTVEQQLISQCKQGNLKHQEMLYKHFYGFAMGVALRYCNDRDDAMEVVNDGFIKVFKTIATFQAERSFKAWLRTIIVNTAIDRKRRDQKLLLNTSLDDAITMSAGKGVLDELNARDILSMLNNLPYLQRAIFNLYEIDGYSHDEIAQMLNIPASSSRVYLTRAKERMRKLLIVS